MFKFLTSKKGFTLVELMTCVAIMGILLCIAVPAFSGVVYAKRKEDCKNNRILIQNLVESIMLGMEDNGKPQDTIPGLNEGNSVLGDFLNEAHVVSFNGEDSLLPPAEPVAPTKPTIPKKPIKGENDPVDCEEDEKETDEQFKARMDAFDAELKNFNEVELVNYRTKLNYYRTVEIPEFNQKMAEWRTQLSGKSHYLYLKSATVGDIRGNYRNPNVDALMDSKLDTYFDEEIKTMTEDGKVYTKTYATAVSEVLNSLGDNTDYNTACENGHYLKKYVKKNVTLVSLMANGELPVCAFDEKGKNGYFYYIDYLGNVYCTCPHCR